MTSQAIENKAKISNIRGRLQRGEITYAEAAEEATPVIERMNARGKEVAKKHGMRHKIISFSELMR